MKLEKRNLHVQLNCCLFIVCVCTCVVLFLIPSFKYNVILQHSLHERIYWVLWVTIAKNIKHIDYFQWCKIRLLKRPLEMIVSTNKVEQGVRRKTER